MMSCLTCLLVKLHELKTKDFIINNAALIAPIDEF